MTNASLLFHSFSNFLTALRLLYIHVENGHNYVYIHCMNCSPGLLKREKNVQKFGRCKTARFHLGGSFVK